MKVNILIGQIWPQHFNCSPQENLSFPCLTVLGERGGEAKAKYRKDLFTSLPLAALAVLISPKCFISVP